MNNLSLIKYELKEINNIINFLDNQNNELDEQTINDTKESVSLLLEEKSDQLELLLKDLELKAENAKKLLISILKKQNKQAKEKSTKSLILEAMQGLDVKRIETETGTFTIKNNNPSLVIDDKSLIPAKFVTMIQSDKIEKEEIKKAIKNGEEIAGVHLETSQSLLVR
ncbi:hypothetical protein JCM16775_p2014 (plasmid) [Leptotrichia hofstadii]|uniref:Siphovirus Gp157 family protein n=1 Tax=Leptotrichia hofstadii TaxID=157688 RepID=A0A510JKE8_9FUSO|nr:siphovirus Gp157 family protein [Leptotrichia hofstadii]BBM39789.1 hypothetical protein JCM16775_p2014 [Leptotrichia hofstadii]